MSITKTMINGVIWSGTEQSQSTGGKAASGLLQSVHLSDYMRTICKFRSFKRMKSGLLTLSPISSKQSCPWPSRKRSFFSRIWKAIC
ncbi:hypothetical protein PO124_06310 [Bacillus licheniformis]|nr:hypothetical protein [Bacillus licheniformis]